MALTPFCWVGGGGGGVGNPGLAFRRSLWCNPPKVVPPWPDQDEELQGDQVNMALFFWYIERGDLSSVHVYSGLHWTSYLIQAVMWTRIYYIRILVNKITKLISKHLLKV